MTVRDQQIANVGRRRRPGRPKAFDREVRVAVDDDLDRRVRSFAAIEQISVSEAWRTLATIGLTELERTADQ